MIAKVPRKRSDGRSSFEALIAYIHRAAATVIHGEAVWSAETAASEMHVVALGNARCRDPVYHYILSWPASERPSDARVADAVRATIADLGLPEHQWVAAIHRTTEHAHVHIVVNRVHPASLRVASLRRDWLTLDRTCRQLELRHGWTHDRGPNIIVDGRRGPEVDCGPRVTAGAASLSTGARDYSAWSGMTSFQAWVASEPARRLQVALKNGARWQAVHDVLRQYNLEYRLKGSGAIVVDRDDPDKFCAKASQLGRFASRSRLEAVLGPFEPERVSATLEPKSLVVKETVASYRDSTNRPLVHVASRRHRADPLYERFRAERTTWRSEHLPRYQAGLDALRQRQRRRSVELSLTYRNTLTAIRRLKSPQLRRQLYAYAISARAAIREKHRTWQAAERDALRRQREALCPGSWTKWLSRQARLGDEHAVKRLRQRRLCERRHSPDQAEPALVTLASTRPPAPARLDQYRVVLGHDSLDYLLRGRIVVRDFGQQIAVYDGTDDAVRSALHLAHARWGSSLTIGGNKAFRDRAARLLSSGSELDPYVSEGNAKAGKLNYVHQATTNMGKPRGRSTPRMGQPGRARKGPDLGL